MTRRFTRSATRAMALAALVLGGCNGLITSPNQGPSAAPIAAPAGPPPASRSASQPNMVRDKFGNIVQVHSVCGNAACDEAGDCVFCPEECGESVCAKWAGEFFKVGQ